jgi:hypothetical protein
MFPYSSVATRWVDDVLYIAVSYCSYNPPELRLATWNSVDPDWVLETVAEGDGLGYLSNSVELDPGANPHISYYDSTSKDLMYAVMEDENWTFETVDSEGDVGKFSSLALTSNSLARIAYWDATNMDLKCAAKTPSGSWLIMTVDSEGRVGEYPSLTLRPNGVPCISYEDQTNGDLKFAEWVGGSWSIETVDTPGWDETDVGYQSSIAYFNRFPHISYFDYTNGDLKYAKKVQGVWNIEVVDRPGVVGAYTSILLDKSGKPHISYYSFTNGELKYAKKVGGTWNIELVNGHTGFNFGVWSSMAFLSNGRPIITYFEDVADEIWYAYRTGSGWEFSRPFTVDPSDQSLGFRLAELEPNP